MKPIVLAWHPEEQPVPQSTVVPSTNTPKPLYIPGDINWEALKAAARGLRRCKGELQYSFDGKPIMQCCASCLFRERDAPLLQSYNSS